MADSQDVFPPLQAEELKDEMVGVELGDERRNARAVRIVEQLASSPGLSFSSMCSSESELEALYRFVRNDQIAWSVPRRPTVADVLPLVARLGGHRESSGRPGWLTLMRGSEKLQNLAEGWELAQRKM